MSDVEQLDLVYKFFYQWKKAGIKFNRPENLYLTAFYPLALVKGWHKNKNYVIGSERSKAWAQKIGQQNKGFDIDNDGLISINDFRKYNKQLLKKLGIKQNNWLWILFLTVIIFSALLFYFYKNGKLQQWLKLLK